MASPQTENGFTKIANELYDVILRSNFKLREMKIILIVIRYTYGFNRKEKELSVRFISKATGIGFQHIGDSIKNLVRKNILAVQVSDSHMQGRTIALNKNYETWELGCSQKSDGGVPKKLTVRVPKRVTKKEIKENIKKVNFSFLDILPKHLHTIEFINAFEDWIKYRTSIRKKMKLLTIKKQIEFLSEQPNPIECIENSIRNQWQGLFEVKSKNIDEKKLITSNLRIIDSNALGYL
jgi:phage replication O-like protein O